MSEEELGRLTLIKGALEGKYTVGFIAKRLTITEQHIKRQFVRRVMEQSYTAIRGGTLAITRRMSFGSG
ncbi:hypothetical protein ACYULU_03030 [Breznakiellaceae bacterium SP9]